MAPPITCECGSCPKCRRREYMRDYYRRNPDKVRAIVKNSRGRRVEKSREYDRERGYRPPAVEKLVARRAVKYALRSGDLIRLACEMCGAEPAQAHHDDYAKPLEVRWLCRVHHGEVHRVIV